MKPASGSSPMETASVARRINGERIVLAAWSRAILMQMAHPLIAAGVADHSAFRGGARVAAHRLFSTVRAMLGLTFGDETERRRVVDHILQIHRRVNGRLGAARGPFPAGTPYSAEDPALVLWVHATLLDSTLLAYQALVGALDTQEADAYCEEAAETAIALGARAAEVPRSQAALHRYMQQVYDSAVLAVDVEARLIAASVLSGPLAAVALPAAQLNRLLTAGWLPAPLRDAYGLAWSPGRARRFDRALRLLKRVRHMTPVRLARWPAAR